MDLLRYVDIKFGGCLGVRVSLAHDGKYTISLNPSAGIESTGLDIFNLNNLYSNIIEYFRLAIGYLASDSVDFSCVDCQVIIKEISKEKPTK